MKKLINILFIMTLMGTWVACSDDETQDPSVRVDEAMVNYKQILTDAPNGWVMYYYGNTEFGGYNILCRFDNSNHVTVANELFTANHGADTTAVTHYKMEQSGGIILSFDEYCELLHYFSDPVNPDGYGSGTADGFGGDLEFRIIAATPDSVILRGKKHNARVKMYPLPENISWADYLTQVQDVAKVMQKGSYHMVMGTDSLTMKANKRNRTLTYYTYDEEGARLTNTAPYVITPQGLTFYTPFNYKEQAVKGFDFAPNTEKYAQTGGGVITLEKFIPALNEQLVEGAWYISEEGIGTFAKNYWRTFRSSLLSNYECILLYGVLGTWRNHFGLSVGPILKENATGVYVSECYFDYEYIGNDTIKMWFNGEFDEIGNGEEFYSNAKMDYAVFPFGGRDESTARTFTIEADDVKDPTWLRLTDQKQRNNVITLSAEQVIYPFGDNN